MGDEGKVVAVERHPGRAQALARTCARMHAESIDVVAGDAADAPWSGAEFDRVLIDPPCSGLGTLQSRPDLRWRASAQSIGELAAIQGRILRAGAAAVAAGGTLVYSVCTISRREGEDVVEAFLAGQPEFAADDLAAELPGWGATGRHLQLRPDTDGTDGFFIARLRRG
jgi:16S rRNA (cytosine967-C5)-methyltransferase